MQVIFDPQIYTKQPAVLTVKEWGDEAYWLKVVVRTAPSATVWYRLPLNESEFSVNLVEIIRMLFETASSYNILEVSTYDEYKTAVIDSVQTIQFYKAGTIDPTKVLRPNVEFVDIDPLCLFSDVDMSVWRPVKVIEGGDIARVIWEMWSARGFMEDEDYYYSIQHIGDLSCTQHFFSPIFVSTRNYEVPKKFERFNKLYRPCDAAFFETENTDIYIDFDEQECGKQYAAVEWISQFGVTRRHIFEVVKQTAAVDGVVSMETIDNGWDERKGSVHGCTLRLDELSRYDYWYYADLILADTAKITFDGVNWYTLQVTAKNYTLPNSDSGQLSTLEIPINYCRYDTI